MVVLKNEDIEFTFESVGYKSPDINGDFCASEDWLNIKIDLKSGAQSFSKTCSALLTYELQNLANWFLYAPNHKKYNPKQIEFKEPYLKFEFVNSMSSVNTRFLLHLSEEFDLKDFKGESILKLSSLDGYFIHFEYSLDELEIISKGFQIEYNKYPYRENR